ncbi:4-amino-4-deoxy-L-arabinose transferase [Aeromicrobium wangtongii]|uniref:4-amino-4-deoxy-L-arabinose transferase n=1 Tax=Aeromicrobium wangtongii TaxID=2969247 RepID=UPI002017177A|nr:4-amino-4-deoxy-L-arabinose transferase [Aeromicrobium wangtongii]MCL3818160.1 4-amino-4-deoxy-L-arabinose transferase [Aeromicrobium wangtongii]
MTSHRYDQILQVIGDRQPACGSTTVVAVDGPSGAGKTSFVAGLAEAAGARVLHLEDVYPGWDGLAAAPPLIAGVLETVAADGIGTVPRWDWEHHRPGRLLRVLPTRLLILDGVGSGAAIIRPYLSLLIWVDAPTAVRKERALARDGGTYAPFWDMWAAQEAEHFTQEATRQHADVVVTT